MRVFILFFIETTPTSNKSAISDKIINTSYSGLGLVDLSSFSSGLAGFPCLCSIHIVDIVPPDERTLDRTE